MIVFPNKQQIAIRLKKQGIALIDNVPLDPNLLIQFANQFGSILLDRRQEKISIIKVKDQKGNSYTNQELKLHTDRSSYQIAPSIIFCVVAKPAEKGGESIFCDGYAIHKELSQKNKTILQKEVAFSDRQGFKNTSKIMELGNIRCKFDEFSSWPSQEIKTQVLNLCIKNMFSYNLQSMQGYLIDNKRYLHGRTHFEGQRQVWRILIS